MADNKQKNELRVMTPDEISALYNLCDLFNIDTKEVDELILNHKQLSDIKYNVKKTHQNLIEYYIKHYKAHNN